MSCSGRTKPKKYWHLGIRKTEKEKRRGNKIVLPIYEMSYQDTQSSMTQHRFINTLSFECRDPNNTHRVEMAVRWVNLREVPMDISWGPRYRVLYLPGGSTEGFINSAGDDNWRVGPYLCAESPIPASSRMPLLKTYLVGERTRPKH